MEWFFTGEDSAALLKRERRLTSVFRVLAGLGAVLFVVLCFLVRTGNMNTMHGVLIAVLAVFGWVCIILYFTGIRETRTHLSHINMLRDGNTDIREGIVTLTRETIQIPKSIRIRKVLLDTGAEEPERLNLDEKWTSRMPPDGSRVKLAVSHSYIAGVEIQETKGTEETGRRGSVQLEWFRKSVKLLPLLGVWTLSAIFLSSFVFYQITDTDSMHKITIYMDGNVKNDTALAARLEKQLSDPIQMVQIHPFRYFMFGSDILKSGDLFIVPESDREQYAEWFLDNGEVGVLYDPGSGKTVAGDTFLYTEKKDEFWRLYIGAASPHLEDGMAQKAAEYLMNMGMGEAK